MGNPLVLLLPSTRNSFILLQHRCWIIHTYIYNIFLLFMLTHTLDTQNPWYNTLMDALPTTPTEWADQAQRNGFVPLSSWKVIKSGSNWTYNELLTFRVLHKNKGQEHPEFLKAYIPEAQEIISNEPRFQKAFSLFDGAEFRKMSYLMLRKHNEFGSFFKILTGLVVDDEKTEKLKLAKFLIWDFLDSVWQCTSDHYSHDRASQFEWSMTSDCLTFKVPNGKYVKTSNDANLIRKLPGRLRHWEREYAQLCYCSIEASMISEHFTWIVLLNMLLQSNATYKTDDEQVQGFAQTTSRILSMIYQRKNHDGKEIFRPDSKAYAQSRYPWTNAANLFCIESYLSCPSPARLCVSFSPPTLLATMTFWSVATVRKTSSWRWTNSGLSC